MMDAVIYCPWCGETVRVIERTARTYANPDGTPHVCGPYPDPVHAMAMQDAEEAGAERSEGGRV